jgi:uncharacterized protein (TIGR00288 family)
MSRKPNFDNDAAEDDVNAGPPPSRSSMNESKIALFIDFENIAIGVTDAKYKKFEVNLLLERLLEKGKIVVKRAYSDWDKFPDYKRELHEAAIELIEIPGRVYSGKNSADIRMVVDAMDMAWSKDHINMFVVASGDSDFSPLVSKLKENDKYVIGVGVKNSSSDLLIDNCDEFIFDQELEHLALLQGQEAGRGVQAPDRFDQGADAREQRDPLGLDDQADDAAQEADLQRGVLRLQHLQRPARGCAEERHHQDQEGREERVLRDHGIRATSRVITSCWRRSR